jgi:L-lactate dehydrogenase
MAMKVTIIGGGGLVGSSAAYALQTGGVVSHVCLIDANQDAAKGHALELLHAACMTSDQRLSAGTMEDVASSNVVVITAGLRRKPDESRLDLINRNVDLFLGLLDQVRSAGLKDKAYLVVVSNPVDVLSYLAVQRSGLPWQPCWGWHAARHRPLPWLPGEGACRCRRRRSTRSSSASTATAWCRSGRVPQSTVCRWRSGPASRSNSLSRRSRTRRRLRHDHQAQGRLHMASATDPRGGGVHARDARRVLPVSTLQQGLYGISDVCLSVPTIVGCGGCRDQMEVP